MDHPTTSAAEAPGFGGAASADWRLLGDRACAWFDAPSHTAGAALLNRIAEVSRGSGVPQVDLRSSGVRVRMPPDPDRALLISSAAAELGLRADPAGLQEMSWVIMTADRDRVLPFWQTVLGYLPDGTNGLVDSLQRNPGLVFTDLPEPRPLRNRLHLDVVRLPGAVESARTTIGQQPYGPWQVALADADGNEVDLCPGGGLTQEPETADWSTVFSAMAYHRTTAAGQAVELAAAAADLADHAGLGLLIDVRSDGVMIDSGKDQWEGSAGPDAGFVELARRVQGAARGLGLRADPARVGFVQLGVDAADPAMMRAFWATLLGYRNDPRPWVTDIVDPRRLNPVIFFQQLDTSDAARRRQRNRLQVELAIPADRVQTMMSTAVSAGGRLTGDDGLQRHTIEDPEGNEIVLVCC